MALPWREVVKKKRYQGLSPDDRRNAQDEYFEQNVASRLEDPAERTSAHREFLSFAADLDKGAAPPRRAVPPRPRTRARARPAMQQQRTKVDLPGAELRAAPPRKPSLIGRGLEALGFDLPEKRTAPHEAAAATVELAAKEEGVSLEEFRAPSTREQAFEDIVGQAGKEFLESATLGLPSRIAEELTGTKLPFMPSEARTTAGEIAGGLGGLAGFIKGPAGAVAHGAGAIISKVLPQATRAGKIVPRTVLAALKEAGSLAAGMTALSAGEILDSKDLDEAGGKLWEAASGGAALGATFGIARGVLPGKGLGQKLGRIAGGIALLDLMHGSRPWDDRELAQKTFDYGLDVFFLLNGLPERANKPAFLEKIKQSINEGKVPKELSKPPSDAAIDKTINVLMDQTGVPPEDALRGETTAKPLQEKIAIAKELATQLGFPVGEVAPSGLPFPPEAFRGELELARPVVLEGELPTAEQRAIERTLEISERPEEGALLPTAEEAGLKRAGIRPSRRRARGLEGIPIVQGASEPLLYMMEGRPPEAPPKPDVLPTAQELAMQRQGLAGLVPPEGEAPRVAREEALREEVLPQGPPLSPAGIPLVQGLEQLEQPEARRPPPPTKPSELEQPLPLSATERPVASVEGEAVTIPERATRVKEEVEAQRADDRQSFIDEIGREPKGAEKALLQRGTVDRAIEMARKKPLKAEASEEERVARFAERAEKGSEGTALTPDNKEIEFDYAVIEADELIVSHTSTFAENTAYPKELQPRERGRAENRRAVTEMSANLRPERLGENVSITDGAPIVGSDGVVESGNGRVMAIDKAYNKKTAEPYTQFLAEQSEKFGLDAGQLEGMSRPVLVRVRKTDVDRAAFVKAANAPTIARMSAVEQAKSDAEKITPELMADFVAGESGVEYTKTNQPFFAGFAQSVVPATERGGFISSKGEVSQEGLARVRNAILFKAYGDKQIITRVAESLDDNSRKISNALIQVAPRFAKLREGIASGRFHDLDIAGDITGALKVFSRLREEGTTLENYFSQGTLFGKELTPEAEELLRTFDQYKGSGKKLGEFLGAYLDVAELAGSPDQLTLFGGEVPSRKDILVATEGIMRERYGEPAQGPIEARPGTAQPEGGQEAAGAPEGEKPKKRPARRAAKEVEVAKKPWQMTKEEYRRSIITDKEIARRPEIEARAKSAFEQAQPGVEFVGPGGTPVQTLGAPNLAQGTLDALDAKIEIARKRHRRLVQAALRQGKAVPAEVLKDYPDLAPPTTPPAIEAVEVPTTLPLAGEALTRSLDTMLKNQRGAVDFQAKAGRQIFSDLVEVGREVISQGKRSYKEFTATFRERIGEHWDKVKGVARRVWAAARKPLPGVTGPGERGAVGRGRTPQVGARVKEPRQLNQQEVQELRDVLRGITERARPGTKYARPSSINLERRIPEGREDLEVLTDFLAETSPRKKQTWDETGALAEEILSDSKKTLATIAKSKAGQALNAQEIKAINQIYVNNIARVAEMGKDPNLTNEELGEQLTEFSKNIFLTTSDANSEAGRALNILKQTAVMGRMGRVIGNLERGLNERELQEWRKLVESGALDKINTEDPVQMAEAMAKIKGFTDRLGDPTLTDYFYEYWYNSILSGIPTHMINAGSNTLWASYQVGHRALEAGAEAVIARLKGRPRQVFMSEIFPMIAGYKKGLKRGAGKAKEVIKTGELQDMETKWAQEIGHGIIGAFSRSPSAFMRKFASPVLTMPSRALRAMDVWANAAAYDAQMASLALREGKKAGKKGDELKTFQREFIADPPGEAIKEAAEFARHSTFMDEPGKISQWFIAGRDIGIEFETKIGGVKIGKVKPLVHIVPFVRTIGNLLKRGIELTPIVGLSQARGKTAANMIAKQIEGAIITFLIFSMLEDDRITGELPKGKNEKAAFYRQGKKPWGMQIGETNIQYRRIEPFNTVIASVALAYDKILNAKDDETATEIFGNVADGMAKNLIDSGYLQGVTQVLDRHGKRKGMLQRQVSSLVPFSSFWRSINRSVEVATEGETKVRETKSFLGAFSQVIPGLSGKMPARLNVWGEEIVMPGGMFRQWLPVKWAKETDDPVEKTLEKIGVYPGLPGKHVAIKGVRTELDDDIYRSYLKSYGSKAKRLLGKRVKLLNRIKDPLIAQKMVDKMLRQVRGMELRRAKRKQLLKDRREKQKAKMG